MPREEHQCIGFPTIETPQEETNGEHIRQKKTTVDDIQQEIRQPFINARGSYQGGTIFYFPSR